MYTFRYSSLVSAGLKAHLLVSMRQICVTFVTAAFARALTIRYHYTYAAPLRNVWVRTAMLIGYAPPSTHVCAPRAAARRAAGAWLTDRGRGSGAPRRGVDPGPPVGRDGGRSTARPGWPVSGVACGGWGGHRTGARLAPYFVDPYFLTRPDSSF